MKQIFVKLPSGEWIRIKDKISVSTRKKTTLYMLLGRLVDESKIPIDKPVKEFYITSGRVNRYICRLLDYVRKHHKDFHIVIEYSNPETYRVRIYIDEEDIAYKTALETNTLLTHF